MRGKCLEFFEPPQPQDRSARAAHPGLAKQHLGGKAFSNSAPGRVRACGGWIWWWKRETKHKENEMRACLLPEKELLLIFSQHFQLHYDIHTRASASGGNWGHTKNVTESHLKESLLLQLALVLTNHLLKFIRYLTNPPPTRKWNAEKRAVRRRMHTGVMPE